MQEVFFCLLLVMSSVNFDVCSIVFVMYFLIGAPFSNFVLLRDYCIPLSLNGFPNATTLLSLSFEFGIKSGDAVLLLIRSCWCDGFHNKVHRLFGLYVTKLIWRTCQR